MVTIPKCGRVDAAKKMVWLRQARTGGARDGGRSTFLSTWRRAGCVLADKSETIASGGATAIAGGVRNGVAEAAAYGQDWRCLEPFDLP